MAKHNGLFLSILLSFSLAACAGSSGSGTPAGQNSTASEPTTTPSPADPSLSICSKLDLSDLDWPSAVDESERIPFALALNISGSFEGPDGWQNLTNNFDGQGLSLGLLNQCLGQGSLQPLLVQMNAQYPGQLQKAMSSGNLKSLLGMLNQWQSAVSINSEFGLDSDMELRRFGFSKLDDPAIVQSLTGISSEMRLQADLISKNQNSVNWAVANLYNGSNFKPDWKTQLTVLAGSSGYRSIQIAAALDLHLAALELFKTYGLTQLRGYLFMFDIVVQNGGIPAPAQTNILAQFKSHPTWNETRKLTAILTERLKYVKSAYVADVKARKLSIIDGEGTVHGAHRDYGQEYCVVFDQPMP